MDQDTHSSANQILSVGANASTSLGEQPVPLRCSICRKRIWIGKALSLEEPAEAPEPQQSWRLCKGCHAAVLTELERSPLHSPVRVRVAVGIVASERWPRARMRLRAARENEDRVWIVFLGWGFAVVMLLHLAIIVLLAQIAK